MICYINFAVFRNVLVKGGDLPSSSDAVDVLFDGMLHISSAAVSQCFSHLLIVLKLIESYDLTF